MYQIFWHGSGRYLRNNLKITFGETFPQWPRESNGSHVLRSAVVLLPLLCFCLLDMRPSVRLGVVPSEMNQILLTGLWQTPDKVDKAKGPKTFALGPLSLKLRWLVSNSFIVATIRNLGNRFNFKGKTILAYFFPPILLSFVVLGSGGGI